MDRGAFAHQRRHCAKRLGLAKAGRIYDLGLELNSRIPHNPEFVRFDMSFTHTPEGTGALSPFEYSVESVFGTLHIGTHIDSFIHIQKDGRVLWRAFSIGGA